MRTYWLSFVDEHQPVGDRFLGVVVADVTDEEAAVVALEHPHMFDPVDGPWIFAAMKKCWDRGVNPGGQVGSTCIDGQPEALFPRWQLLSKDEISALYLKTES